MEGKGDRELGAWRALAFAERKAARQKDHDR